MNTRKNTKITILDICQIGMMVAVIEVCKAAMTFLPNVELTSFWLIMFTLFFGKKIALVVPVFILIEGAVYGTGVWWIMYLYAWPLLVLLVWMFRRQQSVWFWSILSGLFGLSFGLMCSLPYVIIGAGDDGIRSDLHAGFTWWVAGIPWDIVHCVGNFVLMMVLYHPVRSLLKKIEK